MGRTRVEGRQAANVREGIPLVKSLHPILDRPDEWYPYVAPVVSAASSSLGPARVEWSRERLRVLEDSPSLGPFLKLAHASDDEIIRFAETWGPLGICTHGKTVTHADGCQLLGSEERVWLPDEERSHPPGAGADAEYWEPLAAWRFYARQFSAIIAVAYEVSKKRAADARTLAALAEPRMHVGPHAVPLGEAFAELSPREVRDVAADRARYLPRDAEGHVVDSRLSDWVLARVTLKRLVREAGLEFDFPWRVGETAPRNDLSLGEGSVRLPTNSPGDHAFISVGTLFASLVRQLPAAVRSVDGMARCADCGAMIASPSGRKLRGDQNHYCDECKRIADQARWRASKQRRTAAAASTVARTCARPGCTKSLPTNHAGRKYCSDSCRVRFHQEGQNRVRTPMDTPTATNASERT
jgi:hypothetical protein